MRLLTITALLTITTTAFAEPHDFTGEARALYATAACGDTAPAALDAATVAAHCKAVGSAVATWKARFKDKAAPFFAREVGTAPTSVVYPFGGGDLVTALVVYPDACEYTTLSLEGMGDPRVPLASARGALSGQLSQLRDTLAVTFGWAWNTTYQLSNASNDGAHGAAAAAGAARHRAGRARRQRLRAGRGPLLHPRRRRNDSLRRRRGDRRVGQGAARDRPQAAERRPGRAVRRRRDRVPRQGRRQRAEEDVPPRHRRPVRWRPHRPPAPRSPT